MRLATGTVDELASASAEELRAVRSENQKRYHEQVLISAAVNVVTNSPSSHPVFDSAAGFLQRRFDADKPKEPEKATEPAPPEPVEQDAEAKNP